MARRKMKNWVAASILFFSLVAIVITGFGTGGFGGLSSLGGGGTSPGSTDLATVGRVTITAGEANNQFNQDFQQLQRQLPNAQIGEFVSQGGFEGSVDRLISLQALAQYARARGIVATRRMIDHAISISPEFQFARNGSNFDNNVFQTALQRAGISVDQIREEYGRRLMQRQLLQPIQTGFVMPEGVVQAYATVPLEQRSGMIGVVPVGAIERTLNPTEAEVQRYYQRYRDYFTIPERRVIKYAVIGPEQITITPPTDTEIRTIYDNTPRYQAGRIRTLEAVNFGNSGTAQAEATAFVQRVRGGASFQQAAQAAGRGEAYSRRANQTERDFAGLVTAPVAAQAFRAQQGGIVGPIQSQLGWQVVRVETAAGGSPLETVRADIVRELERRKRAAAISTLATDLEQQLQDGTSLEDAANAAHLTIVTTPPVTATGRLSSRQAWPGVTADVTAVMAAAFDIDGDRPRPVVAALPDNVRYALVGVERVEAAAPPPLAEVHDLVRSQLIRRTAIVRARQIADAIAARINAGTPILQAFAQAGLPLPPPTTISARRGQAMVPQAPDSLRLFFRLRPGTAGVIAAPNNGGWMIAAPQQSIRAASAPPEAIGPVRNDLVQVVPQEAQFSLLKAMERSIGVQRNVPAIQAERRRIAGTVGAATQ